MKQIAIAPLLLILTLACDVLGQRTDNLPADLTTPVPDTLVERADHPGERVTCRLKSGRVLEGRLFAIGDDELFLVLPPGDTAHLLSLLRPALVGLAYDSVDRVHFSGALLDVVAGVTLGTLAGISAAGEADEASQQDPDPDSPTSSQVSQSNTLGLLILGAVAGLAVGIYRAIAGHSVDADSGFDDATLDQLALHAEWKEGVPEWLVAAR